MSRTVAHDNPDVGDSPTISVLMSVYNDEKYLEDAVESVLGQTYRDFEFLITDDSSDDNSCEVIREYAEQDERIRVFTNEENQGLTRSLNDMLSKARGELIARMDADDISRKPRFEKQVALFESNPSADIVFGDTLLIDKYGDPVCQSWRPGEEEIIEALGTRCRVPHPTVMMRASAVRKVGGYDESYWTGQDHDLWQRMKRSGATFRYISEVILNYRLNPDSVHVDSERDYWYRVSNECVWNRNKLRALRYLDKLTWKQRAVILFKMIVPHFIMDYRGRKS